MVPSNGVVFTAYMRRDHVHAPLWLHSHHKSNLSESSEFSSCDAFPDVFRNGGGCIDPCRTKSKYRQVVNLDLNRHHRRFLFLCVAFKHVVII